MKRTAAFTLTEMLVVTGVIATLAALLMAAVSRGKVQAIETRCKNNLSQIGKAMAVYTSDFQKYPGTRSAPIAPPETLTPQWEQIWDHRLLPYIAGQKVILNCPGDPSPTVNNYFKLTNYSYGYNAFGTGRHFAGSPLNLGLGRAIAPETDFSAPLIEVGDSAVRAPAEMIAVGDLNDLPSVFKTTIDPFSGNPYPGSPAARHFGGANMVLCDGHVGYARQGKWIEKTDTARRLWNNDHEPHPETW
jgi:prepilin-type processing-associated H-X9-DG protein